ncbi:C-type lectin BpLec-like [Misgurnus anguillicaudatus]|uniref:C-type lectin BpLec-like n=1 Tax=Misgurnus anguillicaudatus TaxID=75329 RepID=UPI003CCF59B8
MYKRGTKSVCFLLLALLWDSGYVLTIKRGDTAAHVNLTAFHRLPNQCNVDGFNNDWYKVDNYCVKYFRRPLNFTDAENSCRRKVPGGHLVSVHNFGANYDLLSIVRKMNPKNLRMWLGGYEILQSGKFLWMDGSFWDYEAWTPGEPRHIYSSKEECVEMNWKGSGKWNDDSCSNRKGYICAFKHKGIMDE